MRAWVIRAHGGVDALEDGDVPLPAVGPGQVRVRVAACAINHLDLWVRRGVAGHDFGLPRIGGADVAGTVDTVAPGSRWEVGTAVVVAPGFGCGGCENCTTGEDHTCRRYQILGETWDGGYGAFVVVPERNVCARPANLSDAQAAALGVPCLTAWRMLHGRAHLRAGEWVLIQGGGSGVGSAAIQIAKASGARVIATASTAAKRERCLDLGADHALPYDAVRDVKALSGGGVQVVVEHIGEATWEQSLRSLAPHGRLVTCGATTGADARVNLRHLFFKSQSLLGSTMGSLGDFRQVLGAAGHGLIRPVIDRELSIHRLREAHQLLDDRAVFGRIVLLW